MATVEHESRQPLKGDPHVQSRSSYDTSQLRAPFSVEVFAPVESTFSKTEAHFASLLPASCRNENDNLDCPRGDLLFLEKELHVDAIGNVKDWLWICGLPMPPRPLHHQVLLSRHIVITENPNLHLVWGKQRIFMKPLPRFLLDAAFWKTRILVEGDPRYHKLARCARGFLFSYCALIAYESDYRIAKENGLIPDTLTWEAWKLLSAEVLRNHDISAVDPRYCYGELRLGRLNTIYRLKPGFFFRGFSRATGHAVYSDLIRDNLSSLAAILGYVVIVLTAMQVGLATEKLTNNQVFQNVSYGFTIFSIFAPLLSIGAIVCFVLVWMAVNAIHSKGYEKRRFRSMGVETPWESPGEYNLRAAA